MTQSFPCWGGSNFYTRPALENENVGPLSICIVLSLSPNQATALLNSSPLSELPATKMCRYRAWEDDFPESEEVHQQNFEERRYGTTAILDQLEECMNEMRAIIESLKEINARLNKINYYLLAFLLLLVGILVSHMCGRSPQVSKMKNSLV